MPVRFGRPEEILLLFNILSDFMEKHFEKLVEKAKTLPKTPGVYLMKDEEGRVIYIGKSASLRDRVGSYFTPATRLEHKKSALLAENRLIKDIQPRYNARLLDDKTFPYLMITTDEEFPGVYVTREPKTKG